MKSFVIIVPSLLAFSFSALAINRVGNGGDAIVCRKGRDLRSAVLLDLFETSLPSASWQGSRDDIAKAVFKRLALASPEQAKHYERRWKELPNELELRDGVALVDIDDSKHVVTPTEKGCAIEQAAVRRNILGDNGKRFTADKAIWEKMDERSKAALLLHEIVYEHLYKLGETDSVKARQLTSYLLSADFEKASPEAYWKRLGALKVPVYR